MNCTTNSTDNENTADNQHASVPVNEYTSTPFMTAMPSTLSTNSTPVVNPVCNVCNVCNIKLSSSSTLNRHIWNGMTRHNLVVEFARQNSSKKTNVKTHINKTYGKLIFLLIVPKVIQTQGLSYYPHKNNSWRQYQVHVPDMWQKGFSCIAGLDGHVNKKKKAVCMR